jgi:hypothetical protein
VFVHNIAHALRLSVSTHKAPCTTHMILSHGHCSHAFNSLRGMAALRRAFSPCHHVTRALALVHDNLGNFRTSPSLPLDSLRLHARRTSSLHTFKSLRRAYANFESGLQAVRAESNRWQVHALVSLNRTMGHMRAKMNPSSIA